MIFPRSSTQNVSDNSNVLPSPELPFSPATTLKPTSKLSLFGTRLSQLLLRRSVNSPNPYVTVNIMRPDSRFTHIPDPIPSNDSRAYQQEKFDAFLHVLESRFNVTPEFTVNHIPHRESGLGNVMRGIMTTVYFAVVTGRSFHSSLLLID